MKRSFLIWLLVCTAFLGINSTNAQCTFEENFDSVTTPALPANFTTLDGGSHTSANAWVTEGTIFVSSPNSVFMSYDGSETVDQYLVWGPLDFSTLTTPNLTFSQRGNFTGDIDTHGLYYSNTAPTTAADLTLVQDLTGTVSEDIFTSHTIPVTGASGTTVYIAFHYTGYNADDWYLDDLCLGNTAPPTNTPVPTNTPALDCSTAIDLAPLCGVATPSVYTNTAGTNSVETYTGCGVSAKPGNEIIFSYASTGNEEINITWSHNDTSTCYLSLLDSCNENDCLDYTYTQGTFSFNLPDVKTYYIVFDSTTPDVTLNLTINSCGLAPTPTITATIAPPPANDACANAMALVLNGSTSSVMNESATDEDATTAPDITGCTMHRNHGVWYNWTAPAGVTSIRVTTCQSDFDTYIALYEGADCNNLTGIENTCKDGAAAGMCGPTSTLTQSGFDYFNVTSGTTYWLLVAGYSASHVGEVIVDLMDTTGGTPTALPTNTPLDTNTPVPTNTPALDCSSAIDLAPLCGVTTPAVYDSSTYTNVVEDYGCGYSSRLGNEIIFSYNSTGNEQVTITWEHTDSSYGYLLLLGSCNEWDCDDYDSNYGANNSETHNFLLADAKTYYFVFDASATDTVFTFTVDSCGLAPTPTMTATSPPAPVNDLCANAITLTMGVDSSPVYSSGATDEDATTAPDITGASVAQMGYIRSHGVWYTWTVPTGVTNARLELCGSDFDTIIGIYTGACGTLTGDSYNDDIPGAVYANWCTTTDTNQSGLEMNGLTEGTTYYILVGGYSNNTGMVVAKVIDTSGGTPTALPTNTPADTNTPAPTSTPALNCSSAIDLAPLCGNLTPTTYDTNTGVNNVEDYNCTTYVHSGNELVFMYTSSIDGEHVKGVYDYSHQTSGYLDLMVLDACNEYSCIARDLGFASGPQSFDFELPTAGTYYFVFDGESGFNTDFTLAIELCGTPPPTETPTITSTPTITPTGMIDCSTAVDLAPLCGNATPTTYDLSLLGASTDVVESYGITTDTYLGNEKVFSIQVRPVNPLPYAIWFSFSSTAGADQHVFITKADNCNEYALLGHGYGNATGSKTYYITFDTPGTYYFIFDTTTDVAATIDLSIDSCGPLLDCSSAVDIKPLCGVMTPTTYDTNSGVNNVEVYANNGYNCTGNELVFSYTSLSDNEVITGHYDYPYQSVESYLDLMVLNSCNEHDNLDRVYGYDGIENTIDVTLPTAGTYYFVFDGEDAFNTTFDLTLESCGVAVPTATPTQPIVVPTETPIPSTPTTTSTPMPQVRFDYPSYDLLTNPTANLSVFDRDASGTVSVTVTSDTDATGITFDLTLGTTANTFEGQLNFTTSGTSDATAVPPVIQVTNGDTVTLTYGTYSDTAIVAEGGVSTFSQITVFITLALLGIFALGIVRKKL